MAVSNTKPNLLGSKVPLRSSRYRTFRITAYLLSPLILPAIATGFTLYSGQLSFFLWGLLITSISFVTWRCLRTDSSDKMFVRLKSCFSQPDNQLPSFKDHLDLLAGTEAKIGHPVAYQRNRRYQLVLRITDITRGISRCCCEYASGL